MSQRPCLSSPIRIGKMIVKNRMVMPPMNTNYSSDTGALTPRMEQYYLRRAQGGVGMMVLEAVAVAPDTRNHGVQPMLYDEKYVPAWSCLIEQLQSYGVKVSIEIAHFGSEATLAPRVSSSDVTRHPGAEVRALDLDGIRAVQRQFVETVKHAKMAGADAVTLHGAHGYLIAEFLSLIYNHRTDAYGGSLENRARFLTELIADIRAEVGPGFPIIVRYSVDEFAEGGRSLEESVELAGILERAGVDAIDLSAGIPAAYIFTNPPHSLGHTACMLAPYAEKVKAAVHVPVICANTIRTPDEVEEILASGKADMVALGRTLLADADFPNKALAGRDSEIRRCMSCQYCFKTLDSGRALRCAVNAETGRECDLLPLRAAEEKKRVAVIGGGPAGMEAARVAALRGHSVTLYEKDTSLGGSLIAAAIPPHKEPIAELVRWYEEQLRLLGVEIRLGQPCTPKQAADCGAQQIAVATGADYLRRIPGSDRANVLTAVEALRNPARAAGRIVIIGGGATGAETAEFFAGDGVELRFRKVDGVAGKLVYDREVRPDAPQRDVTLVEMLPAICTDMDEFNRAVMLAVLPEKGVKIRAGLMVREISGQGVTVSPAGGGDEELIPADTVILAGGLMPHPIDAEGVDIPVIPLGDSVKPGRIADALYSAAAQMRRI